MKCGQVWRASSKGTGGLQSGCLSFHTISPVLFTELAYPDLLHVGIMAFELCSFGLSPLLWLDFSASASGPPFLPLPMREGLPCIPFGWCIDMWLVTQCWAVFLVVSVTSSEFSASSQKAT